MLWIARLRCMAFSFAMLLAGGGAEAGTLTTLYSFGGTSGDGLFPQASLTYGNGVLYGVTTRGGGTGCKPYGCGTAFSIDPTTGAETILHSFTDVEAEPSTTLLLRGSHLYGTTLQSNGYSTGSAFSLDLPSLKEKTLYSFTTTSGDTPKGALISANGLLYGTTSFGGISPGGTIYSLDPKTRAVVTLHFFADNKTDGGSPATGLTLVKGALYGTNTLGGSNGWGTIFKYDLATSTYSVVYSFVYPVSSPLSTLISDGKYLYGTTYTSEDNLGTIFKFAVDTGTFSILYEFPHQAKGESPVGSIVLVDRYIYGTTIFGGSSHLGNIYRVGMTNGKEEVLYSFTGGADGRDPTGLTYENGVFYGVTEGGGLATHLCRHNHGCGTVFKFTP